jgi:glutamate-1-semialdehyde aminotransferase
MDMLAEKAFLSSTFFPNSLAQVAALKTIEILQRDSVLETIAARGEKFAKKIRRLIKGSGVPCEFSGQPWMPYITFRHDEAGLYKKLRKEFYTQLIRRKVFLQPYHHGYIAYRHSVRDLNHAADMIGESFDEIKKLL